MIDVTIAIASDAGAIPSSELAAPLDRLLVATARDCDLPLVTCDRAVLDYAARTRMVRVIDGRR